MMNENRLRKYAKLIVVMGANVQQDQIVVLNASVETKDFARMVVEEAYKCGAKQVIMNWSDDYVARMHYTYQNVETLSDVKDHQVEAKLQPLLDGACNIRLESEIPEILSGLDMDKIAKSMAVRQKAFKQASDLLMASKNPWTIAGVPNQKWANKVFPDLSEEDAMEALWEAILKTVLVEEDNDPINAWKKHNETLKNREKIMNDYNFKTLHFENKEGTDLYVDLVENHIWAGGSEVSGSGIEFNANMPTEELFCMPYKYGVNGKVVSTKPLSYNGCLIEKFSFVFKDGKVIEKEISNEEEVIEKLLEMDEGSSYLGEVALVPYSSPISQSNLLFYDTLYDENASCHLALGQAYPMNVKNGTNMSEEELKEAGSNISYEHVDFMFGSEDMKITGITYDGKEIKVFENGNFVF